jgi:tetratricopeptide (TPR) repeat protein
MDWSIHRKTGPVEWGLLALFLILLAGAGYKYATSDAGGNKSNAGAAEAFAVGSDGVVRNAAGFQIQKQRRSSQQLVIETIRNHQERIDSAPESKEVPAYLNAIGNLYGQKLGEYEKAISYYERILEEYPDWPNIRGVYPKLARYYELAGEQEQSYKTYQRMMKAFPEDSQEHLFAQQMVSNLRWEKR